MDQDEQERERGITINVAKAHFETKNTRFTILDAPGHRDFVPNMIDGASQAECAILAIDARPNHFETGFTHGNTQNHAILARSVGVT